MLVFFGESHARRRRRRYFRCVLQTCNRLIPLSAKRYGIRMRAKQDFNRYLKDMQTFLHLLRFEPERRI
ncbi:hypothetical protein WL29_28885 [Burkholderia ubonensis]|uniref:Uncharacterized protein n=1 Tax=Burkholderia ubonensis TaxID=101571 RepID=A0A106Q8E5_9BURK|nr:hypothetical protein WL29_28885 [Burkholderia ubonensis]